MHNDTWLLESRLDAPMPNTVAENVADFLIRSRPKAYCDDCLAKALGKNRRQIQAVTVSLGATNGFSRAYGLCSERGEAGKLVIHA